MKQTHKIGELGQLDHRHYVVTQKRFEGCAVQKGLLGIKGQMATYGAYVMSGVRRG